MTHADSLSNPFLSSSFCQWVVVFLRLHVSLIPLQTPSSPIQLLAHTPRSLANTTLPSDLHRDTRKSTFSSPLVTFPPSIDTRVLLVNMCELQVHGTDQQALHRWRRLFIKVISGAVRYTDVYAPLPRWPCVDFWLPDASEASCSRIICPSYCWCAQETQTTSATTIKGSIP